MGGSRIARRPRMDETAMDPITTNGPTARRVWDIDRRLCPWVGRDVRIAVDAFSPARWEGDGLPLLSPVRDLILPDNSRVGSLPVFFEGRLRRFERRIGVVYVGLEAPTAPDASVEGIVLFRGALSVILRGPATVRCDYPFRVEPVPIGPLNYWEDLRIPTAQFRLNLD